MIGKLVGISFLFIILMIPTITAFEQVEEPPGEAELAGLTQLKMTDITTTCLTKMEIEGVDTTLAKQCYALFTSYNEHMKQLFNEHKDAIDHILYG